MAKRGQQVQLQAEVNTEEELLEFLQKDGLLVLNVYTGWCGPCVAMVGNLKKVKMEKGGDDMHFAIVKCDNIQQFSRYVNKCEPVWLIASHGKLVNGYFGVDGPKFMAMIIEEFEIEMSSRDAGYDPRQFFDIDQMLPFELGEYIRLKEVTEREARIKKETDDENRRLYILYVTDKIMDNSKDVGITIMMPHIIDKDLPKRLQEYGDANSLSYKDRVITTILPEHYELIHFENEAPISPIIQHVLEENECMIVVWSKNGKDMRPIEELLEQFRVYVSEPKQFTSDPPIFATKMMKISIEQYASIMGLRLNKDGEIIEGDESVQKSVSAVNADETIEAEQVDSNDMNENGNEEVVAGDVDTINVTPSSVAETTPGNAAPPNDGNESPKENVTPVGNVTPDVNVTPTGSASQIAEPGDGSDVDSNKENYADADAESEEGDGDKQAEAEEVAPEGLLPGWMEAPIVPVWTPTNTRTNAAFIYLYFRALTKAYLPPDPVPEPPHLLITFEAHKRDELANLFDIYRKDILAYGYFTSDDFHTAKLIANSTKRYEKGIVGRSDIIAIKVAKRTSHALLALSGERPTYVSFDTDVGPEECIQFFPEEYENADEEEEDEVDEEDEEPEDGEEAVEIMSPNGDAEENAEIIPPEENAE